MNLQHANKSGWKAPPLHTDGFAMPGTEGNWYGVTVSYGNVRFLSLSNNNLNGSIPSQISNLWDLVALNLSHNQLSGVIPSSLTKLTYLYNLDIGYNCLSATDPILRAWLYSRDPDWEAHQDQCGVGTPVIGLASGTFHFGGTPNGYKTGPQVLNVSNKGSDSLNWSVTTNQNWLSCTPTSGEGYGTVTVSIDPTGLTVGTYTGTITVSDPNAANSPQTATIILKVYNSNQTSIPFGDFATPIDGSKVSGSIAVTGWVLDDIGVESVKIYRTEGNNKVYIGDAVFVEGARPDVEQAYPDYPLYHQTGWGYMRLTNFLPNGGNGSFKIHAIATDAEGHQVTLGTKTIICDNANAVKPFGAIDTPTQGGTASGSNFVNWGWALTPQPNMIPTDGTTIDVWVDGVKLGHPTYNIYRSDLASLFPGYANSNGAVGYFYIDTTTYDNGVHSIQWTAVDSVGNTDGIGSRYFMIQNTGNSPVASANLEKTSALDIKI